MTDLLSEARAIWGNRAMTLPEIAVAVGVVQGDLCRVTRRIQESGAVGAQDADDAQRELGNLILSAVRWADDLGLDLTSCVTAAVEAQRAYVAKLHGSAGSSCG